MQGNSKKRARIAVFAILLAALGVIGVGALSAANAAPSSATAVTSISNRPDSGHGGVWAYDTVKRTATVTLQSPQPATSTFPAGVPLTDQVYTETISDSGAFTTIPGALTPNQSTAALKVAHAVDGTLTGSYTLTVYAPSADTLTGTVPAAEDDQFSTLTAGFVSTGNWANQFFATPTDKIVGGAYNWTYTTGCNESWVDSSGNGDGNLPADGNITGKTCATPPATLPPYVFGGQVTSVNNNRASVQWSESKDGWPDAKNKCEEVWISGYGFGAWNQADPTNPGTSHVGFTCEHDGSNVNTGYLTGLAAGHTYALRIVPATGDYGHHTPIPGALVGYVDVFTTR